MNELNEFTLGKTLIWGEPLWFWGLLILPLALGLFVWAERRRSLSLQRLVAARLQSTLAGSVSGVKRRVQFVLMLAALGCFIITLAAPRYGYTFEEAKRKGRDVVIAIDTSRSMLATDVVPSRLARAKLAAQDLINTLGGDRVGLVAFAGSAFLQAPLTVDYNAVLSSLNELDTDIIPRGGTNLAEAIAVASKAFGKGEGESRALVLFTDGEELDADVLATARQAAGSIRIFTVGVGSGDGSLIPVPGENGGTEFVKDPQGNFVKSRLDESKLKEIAELTGGFYVHLQNAPAEMRRIVDDGLNVMKESETDARMSRKPIERFQWPLGAGLALLVASMLINDRRSVANGGSRKTGKGAPGAAVAGAFILAASLAATARTEAADGNELFAQKRYEEAGKAFEEAQKRQPNLPALHYNKAAADYAQGKYDEAVDGFSRALAATNRELRSKAEYNLGTTLLQRALRRDGKERDADLKNAIQHLEEAAKLDPKIAEVAAANKEIAKKKLEEPKPPKQKKDDSKKDKEDKNKNDQSKNDQSKDDQSKNDQSKNDQSKDDQSKDDQSKDDQSKNDQSKNDQSKNDQSKDDQSKDDQSKDDQSKDDQSKNDQSKDDQSKDDQSKNDQSKDDQSKNDQSKDDRSKDDQSKDDQSKDQPGKPEPSPTPKPGDGSDNKPDSSNRNQPPAGAPTPAPDEQKPSGDIKAQESNAPAGDAAAAAEEPANPNEMSENQARALLDSLKGEDDQPSRNEQRGAAPVLKNW